MRFNMVESIFRTSVCLTWCAYSRDYYRDASSGLNSYHVYKTQGYCGLMCKKYYSTHFSKFPLMCGCRIFAPFLIWLCHVSRRLDEAEKWTIVSSDHLYDYVRYVEALFIDSDSKRCYSSAYYSIALFVSELLITIWKHTKHFGLLELYTTFESRRWLLGSVYTFERFCRIWIETPAHDCRFYRMVDRL